MRFLEVKGLTLEVNLVLPSYNIRVLLFISLYVEHITSLIW